MWRKWILLGLLVGVLIVAVVTPALGRTKIIVPPGLSRNPHDVQRYDKIVECGRSGNTNVIDPVHICGWR